MLTGGELQGLARTVADLPPETGRDVAPAEIECRRDAALIGMLARRVETHGWLAARLGGELVSGNPAPAEAPAAPSRTQHDRRAAAAGAEVLRELAR